MWVTVRVAARGLGISENAVRNMVKRGTLQAERRQGRVYVSVDRNPRPSDASAGRPSNEPTHLSIDAAADQWTAAASNLETEQRRARRDYDDLVEAWSRDLRRQIGRLEGQIDALNAELKAERAGAERLTDSHGEDMRRMATLLQTAQ